MDEHLGILRGSSTASAPEVQPDPDQASTSSAPSQEAPPQGFIRHQVLPLPSDVHIMEHAACQQATQISGSQVQKTDNLAGLAIRYNVTVKPATWTTYECCVLRARASASHFAHSMLHTAHLHLRVCTTRGSQSALLQGSACCQPCTINCAQPDTASLHIQFCTAGHSYPAQSAQPDTAMWPGVGHQAGERAAVGHRHVC